MCKSIIHNEQSRKAVAPLGLTLFVWILLMNAMDMLPVDLLPMAWQGITGNHHALLRVVPTADLNTTLALAIGVLLICIYYNVKMQRPWRLDSRVVLRTFRSMACSGQLPAELGRVFVQNRIPRYAVVW